MATETSQISAFFANQTVFLTGGSGFVGKVLIEKLLRECIDLKKIFVLIREKKGKTPEQRFDELFSYLCFDRIRSNNETIQKVHLVNGDCRQPLLGMSHQDVEILKAETTCVIHAAANVKFDQTLQEAASYVETTREILEIAKQMTKLRVFVYVSTAFSNSIYTHIKEEFYEPPMTPENLFSLIRCLDSEILDRITPALLGKWHNSYIWSKCISEDLVKSYGRDLPIAIVRPSIIISSDKEPVPGWIDNFYGAVGVTTAAGWGLIRSLHVKPEVSAILIPVDYVSNCILAVAWKNRETRTTRIYNCVGSEKTRLSWHIYMKLVEEFRWTCPSNKCIWYYCLTFRSNRTWHRICVFFLHKVPAYLADLILICVGRKPIAVEGYRRLDKMLDFLIPFTTTTYTFDDDHVTELWDEMNDQDKQLFNFNLDNINWKTYISSCLVHARRYLFKESPESFPQAIRWMRILGVIHYTVLALWYYCVYKLISFLFGLLF